MKILIVNKYAHTGGAAIAAYRTYQALKKAGADVRFYVMEGEGADKKWERNFVRKALGFGSFVLGRGLDYLVLADKSNKFFFDSARIGVSLRGERMLEWADVIHLHWINFGFLSLSGLKKILLLQKPVLWTLHDMWALTGGCFHSRGCVGFQTVCSNCPYLKEGNTLAAKVMAKKKALYELGNLNFIAISSWIEQQIRASAVFNGRVYRVPNPIDTDFFVPTEDKIAVRRALGLPEDKIIIGFIAYNVSNPYKGISYLLKAIKILREISPQIYDRLMLLAIGKIKSIERTDVTEKIRFTGYVKQEEQMRSYYQTMDLFVLPSLEENLPLVLQEAMSCGVPCVAFSVGGIPDLIEHEQTGYLAKVKDSEDLARGILWALENGEKLRGKVREYMVREFSYKVVSQRFLEVYEAALSDKKIV